MRDRAPVVFLALVCSGFVVQTHGQADGNPHGWDRKRRCDEQDYDPPCGVCEGIGGIPTGDKNSDITITSCVPGPAADPETAKRPIFGSAFKVDEYFEVLIGKKNDPFCFQAFPGNDSVGELCYRPQQGSQVYDSNNRNGLRYDVDIVTVVGNVSSTVIHQDENMWIINHFPWYALGLKQCICTQPRQGGDWTTPKVYPIQYNWTNHLRFVGREVLGVEYIWTTKTLDHWAFGPHHVWTLPESGQILRMWQPFNGLEVFPKGLNPSPVDDEAFAEIPPKVCTKDAPFGTIKVKCTDDGYPVPHKTGTQSLEGQYMATVGDLQRASAKVPRRSYRGENFTHMSEVLNRWLTAGARGRPCSSWSITELQQLQASLFLLRDAQLDETFQRSGDQRRMRLTMLDLQSTWQRLNELAAQEAQQVQHMHRDGHCHEAVMWYVHHLSEDAKQILALKGVEIPLLSPERHDCAATASQGHAELCRAYEEQVTCASCHSAVYPTPSVVAV